jgi:hypothetical protein
VRISTLADQLTDYDAHQIFALIASDPRHGGLADYLTPAERERLRSAAARRLGGVRNNFEAIVAARQRHLDGERRIAEAIAELLEDGVLDPLLSPTRRQWLARVLDPVATGSIPNASVIEISRNRNGAYTCVVVCPWCPPYRNSRPRKHTHGLPNGAADLPTSRVAHCGSNSPGVSRSYRLVTEAGVSS